MIRKSQEGSSAEWVICLEWAKVTLNNSEEKKVKKSKLVLSMSLEMKELRWKSKSSLIS